MKCLSTILGLHRMNRLWHLVAIKLFLIIQSYFPSLGVNFLRGEFLFYLALKFFAAPDSR